MKQFTLNKNRLPGVSKYRVIHTGEVYDHQGKYVCQIFEKQILKSALCLGGSRLDKFIEKYLAAP